MTTDKQKPCLPECYSWVEKDFLTNTPSHGVTHAPNCPNAEQAKAPEPVEPCRLPEPCDLHPRIKPAPEPQAEPIDPLNTLDAREWAREFLRCYENAVPTPDEIEEEKR